MGITVPRRGEVSGAITGENLASSERCFVVNAKLHFGGRTTVVGGKVKKWKVVGWMKKTDHAWGERWTLRIIERRRSLPKRLIARHYVQSQKLPEATPDGSTTLELLFAFICIGFS